MNKIVATAAIAGAAILSPVASMGVSPVREALLGMAPDEQILSLADKIDESRVANEQKLSEIQQELDSAKQTIAEQKATLESQKSNQDARNAEQDALSEKIECSSLRSKYVMCNNEGDYRKDFSSFLKDYLKSHVSDQDGDREKKEWAEIATKNYNICQGIYKQCD
jgi:septal ring factor EnvC (AmiA/AmiB activator)